MRTWLAVASLVLASIASSASAQDDDAARDACGAAAYTAAEVRARAFDSFEVHLTAGPPSELTHRLATATQAASERAQSVIEEYQAVIRCNSPRWNVAALVRQATIYQHLVDAVLAGADRADAFVPPTPGRQRLRASIEPQLASVHCLAVVRRLFAVRLARTLLEPILPRAATLDRDLTQAALDTLTQIPVAEITTCVDMQRRSDPSFGAFTPHDIAPFPPGPWTP